MNWPPAQMPLGIHPMDICGGGMCDYLRTSVWEASCELARAAKGFFTREYTHWVEFHTDMTLCFYVVFTSCSSPLADQCHTKKSGCSCLHNIVAKFCTGVKFSFCYNNRGELKWDGIM